MFINKSIFNLVSSERLFCFCFFLPRPVVLYWSFPSVHNMATPKLLPMLLDEEEGGPTYIVNMEAFCLYLMVESERMRTWLQTRLP